MDLSPYTEQELWDEFHRTGSITKHLLTLYSLAVGVNAKRIIDIGIGTTTRTLRAAAARTGGTVFSCDVDKKRFDVLLDAQTEHWKLFLGSSDAFLDDLEGPVDFAVHDGAHDYYQVKEDLLRILPKMKTFGLVCIHDTQQFELGPGMMDAIRDSLQGRNVSFTTLPYCCGLTIIRMEQSGHPAIEPAGKILPAGHPDTVPIPLKQNGLDHAGPNMTNPFTRLLQWVKWKARRMIKGY